MKIKSIATYASLDEVEIYVRQDDSTNEQTPYVNAQGSAYILHEIDAHDQYDFNEVWIMSVKSIQLLQLKGHQNNN